VYTKKDKFDYEEVSVAALAKSLSHPARIAIVKLLLERKQCLCGDIVNELPLSQSTVSQHLKELKDVGLLDGRSDGPRVYYSINEETWNKAKIFFDRLFRKLQYA
jgi:ArsR family transcriptional regulator, arsenate/arsenite/antimonite-responsive transcriptional repressor